MKTKLEKIRQDLLVLENTFDYLKEGDRLPSRELSLAFTNLQEARMFVGTMLKYLTGYSPYKKDGRIKEIKDIAPLYQTTDNKLDISSKSIIEIIDIFRERIEEYINTLHEFIENIPILEYKSDLFFIANTTAIQSLMKIKMWLGMELNRIRNLNLE